MKRIVNLMVVLGIIGMFGVAFIPESVAAMTGSGTEGDPYMIYDVDDLQDMNLDLDAYYELANDIDASDTETWNGGAGFEPVGNSTDPFIGSFDGAGFTISGLFINRPSEDDIGLLGFGSVMTIQNVGLVDVAITGSTNVGGLIGHFGFGDCLVDNCSVTGVVVGGGYGTGAIGGLIGYIEYAGTTQINNCYSTTDVSGQTDVGGFIGGAYSVVLDGITFTSCYATGDVYFSGSMAGGFAGAFSGCTVSECYATGNVTGGSDADGAGGFVGGTDTTTISQCYAIGDIELTKVLSMSAGGFASGIYATDNTIIDCYARGEVIGNWWVGGFVGHINVGGAEDSNITNCYSTGAVTGSPLWTGGLIGTAVGGTVTDSFWDTETSGQATSDGGTSKTTAQMKTESTYTEVGWDFGTIWDISLAPTINNGYPYLLWGYDSITSDVNQVVWFQPNYIIQGTELPNRTGEEDGVIHWGTNPAGITISNGELIPEDEYDFEPIIPGSTDIIKPEPGSMVGDVDLERLHDNPLYPLVQVLTIPGFLTEKLVWLGLAWIIVIGAMLGVHLGFDTHKDTEKPQHFILTTIAGLGLSIIFYTMGIFPLWVVILMAFGLVGAIIWERQPVI